MAYRSDGFHFITEKYLRYLIYYILALGLVSFALVSQHNSHHAWPLCMPNTQKENRALKDLLQDFLYCYLCHFTMRMNVDFLFEVQVRAEEINCRKL